MKGDLGATSIDKIGEVQLFHEIGEGGFENLEKPNFMITITYKQPTFLLVGPFFEEEGVVLKILGIFSIEVAP